MKAIILVGGFGTRLQSVVSDLPKPMAPIADKPFLAYLLDYLHSQGIKEIIFPLHYLAEKISDYFGNSYLAMPIHYVYEKEALGTGGAIVNALNELQLDEDVLVLNGDTFVKLDYQAFIAQHQTNFSMALHHVDDCTRYGSVSCDDEIVTGFKEKGTQGPGYINAGVYLLNVNSFKSYNLSNKFSIEKDFLFPFIKQIKPIAFKTEKYFIDIGIPEDYLRACVELPRLCYPESASLPLF